jgi:hypothetical protein
LFEKAKTLFNTYLPKITQAKKLGMKLLLGYVCIAVLIVFIYLFAWFYQWLVLKQLSLKDLKELLTLLLNPYTIAALGFVMTMLVDKNHNGISDDIENKLKEETGNAFVDKK